MNKIIPLVVLATMLTQVVHAQIKRQYKDEKFAKQTVVVKTEESISDLDILNSQFDMDDVAVGEVIRITTETDPEKAPAVPEQVEEEEIVAHLDTPETEELIEIEQEEPEEVIEVIEVETTQRVKSTPAKKSEVRSMSRSSSKVKSKKRNPRFKKKKRKRSKRWKTKCYRF